MAIDIIFGSVTAADKASYVSQKLKDFFQNSHDALGSSQDDSITDERLLELTAVVCDGLASNGGNIPLAANSDFPTFTPRQQEVVDLRGTCFINEVNALSPLMAGEKLEGDGDFVSYLQQDFGKYAAGTPMLKRTTNMATLYYPATHIQVTPDGNVTELARATSDPLQTEAAQSPLESSAVAIPEATATGTLSSAESIAKGLAWALPPPYSAIGATVLNLLFPDSSGGINWTLVFQQFSQIVIDADTETTIHTQDGLLNGVLSDINSYMNVRDENSKKDRTNMLNGYLSSTNAIVGVLQQDQFAQKGLATFMHAAGVEMAILQEMAKQDPNVSDPLQSGNVATISQNAKTYAQHATNVRDTIINNLVTARGNQITQPKFYSQCGGGIPPTCITYYYYKDKQTGHESKAFTQHGKKDSPHKDCQKARNTYFNNVTSQYRTQLDTQAQWITDTINWWQKLIDTPLPQGPYTGS